MSLKFFHKFLSNPAYRIKKLKLQYFGHVVGRTTCVAQSVIVVLMGQEDRVDQEEIEIMTSKIGQDSQ